MIEEVSTKDFNSFLFKLTHNKEQKKNIGLELSFTSNNQCIKIYSLGNPPIEIMEQQGESPKDFEYYLIGEEKSINKFKWEMYKLK